MKTRGSVLLAILTSASAALFAQQAPVSFRKDVAPILQENCLACHGPKKAEGGYRVDSFERATKAPNRVLLDFEHHVGISDVLGHGVEFEERDGGLIGKFRVDEGSDGDKALRLIAKDVLRGASVMFKSLAKPIVSPSGVVQRVKVHLDRVSLCRIGAYETAQVLAVRTQPIIPAAQAPIPFDPVLASNIAKYATVPDGLKPLEAST